MGIRLPTFNRIFSSEFPNEETLGPNQNRFLGAGAIFIPSLPHAGFPLGGGFLGTHSTSGRPSSQRISQRNQTPARGFGSHLTF